jgi:hypothetical protein
LIHRIISFLAAFALEALVYSDELWAKVPIGVTLAMIVLLIFWCVSTTFEAKTVFSFLGGVHALKDGIANFTRSLRGKVPETEPDVESARDGGDRGKTLTLSQSGSFKEAFNRLRRPQRRRASTSSTLVDPTRSNKRGSPNAATVEMGGVGPKKEPGDVV